MRHSIISCCLSVSIVLMVIPGGAAAETSNLSQPSGSGAAGKLIDLTKADPSKLDLATADPRLLDLSRDAIQHKIDVKVWDLKKLDVHKLTKEQEHWIGMRYRDERDHQKELSQYKPGELERKQEENLKWLKKSEPYVEPTVSRAHKLKSDQIAAYAKSIDDIVLAKLTKSNEKFNPLTTDEQFVRRVYISAGGRIPDVRELQTFLADPSPAKRQAMIDKMLLSDDYSSQMFNWFGNMLRVRDIFFRNRAFGDTASYQAWLMDQIKGNRPWDKTVHEMLSAEGDIVASPAVGWLTRDAGMPLDSLSNTLTTFMGANVSCAQCHDHPFASYTQREFYQLAAFFGSTDVPGARHKNGLKYDVRGAPAIIKDKFEVVINDPSKYLTFPQDYKYSDVKPNTRVTPSFPMLKEMAPRTAGTASKPLNREDFAAWMTNKKNQQFAATIANRLWKKIFGVAVMEPVTEMDDLTRAGNPELIKALAKLMQDLDYDLLAFQRVLYNTRAFQARSSESPDFGAAYHFPGPVLRRMTAEEAWDSLVTLVRGDNVDSFHRDRRKLLWSDDVFKDGFYNHMMHEVKAKIEDDKLLAAAEKLAAERQAAVGYRKSKENDKYSRASEMPQPQANSHFLREFGQSERELPDAGSNEGSIPQVLALMNGPVSEMLSKPDSYIMTNAKKASSESGQIEFIYLAFLGRKPTPFERDLIAQKKIALGKLTWILMNTREFMFVQ